MVENQIFISVKEICKTLSVSESKALVAEYEFPKNTGGGYYIKHALMEKLGMEEIIAKNMLQYIPQILLPKNQRKAKELLDECENV